MTDTICYSGAPSKSSARLLGTPHYSYRFAEEKFLRCLRNAHVETHFLSMPEFYSAPQAYEQLPTYRGRYVHMIFRSTEEIRILKSGYNIVCYAWEFPFIKDETAAGEHPFLNQKRMLLLCDEVWVPCQYTKEVLATHGVDNVYVIPAPIAVTDGFKPTWASIIGRLGHVDTMPFISNFLNHGEPGRSIVSKPLYAVATKTDDRSARKIFLSVFNPEDFRKNLDALIRGFDVFQQRTGRDDILIIKALTARERFSLEQVVCNVMANKLASGTVISNENVIVFSDLLSAEDMSLLYDLADFYVCTSLAEGQNLPLQEAMSQGVVPITTLNTAMLDYVDEGNAIIITTERQLNTCEHLAGNIAGKPYEVEICTAAHVAKALDAGVALDTNAYERRSIAARKSIEDNYSFERVKSLVLGRFEAIQSTDVASVA